jgi:hypothetical protein
VTLLPLSPLTANSTAVSKWLNKAQTAVKACIDRGPVYILYRYYSNVTNRVGVYSRRVSTSTLELNCGATYVAPPVTVVERSKACTVFARSEAGIVGSNPTQGMDV